MTLDQSLTINDPGINLMADMARRGFMPEQQNQFIAVELVEQRQDVGHEFCFSLHVMHTRVHGIAFNRAGAIGSPQSRQMP